MLIIERIDGFRVALGGRPHSGWLPPNAAVPPPTPRREVDLDLAIESDGGDGYLLIFEARDGSLRGDTWHASVADARAEALDSFGVPPEAWRRADAPPAAG